MKYTQTLYVLGIFAGNFRYNSEQPYLISEYNLAAMDAYKEDYYFVRELLVDFEVDENSEEMLKAINGAIDSLEGKKDEIRQEMYSKIARIDEKIADFRKLTYQPAAQEYFANEDQKDAGDDTDL